MRTATPPTIALLLTALALAGCSASNGPGGQSASAPGTLAYNGAENGSHSSTFHSNGACTLHLSGNLGSGHVTVTLTTSAGTVVSGSIDGPGQKDEEVGRATGPAGTWTLKAERTSNQLGAFSGQYAATAAC